MNKRDIYQEVTDRVIAALEAGTVPWRKPWKDLGGASRNLNSNRPYRGINIFLTAITAMLAGYTDSRWATFKGIKKAGGTVRKGEKGTLVILWKPIVKNEGTPDEETFLILRHYYVFNVQQADWPDGPPKDGTDDDELIEFEPHEVAEKVVARYCLEDKLEIRVGGDRAAYSDTLDLVMMPEAKAFENSTAYYATLFHELVHSTGHKSRLDRFGDDNIMSTEPYAKEELVAEMGNAMILGVVGMEPRYEENAAYVKAWLSKLRDDSGLLISAAAKAQKAADRVLGTSFDKPEAAKAEEAATAVPATV